MRFNVYFPAESYEALETLRQRSGKRSLAETIRSALDLYSVVQCELKKGKRLYLEGGGERVRLLCV